MVEKNIAGKKRNFRYLKTSDKDEREEPYFFSNFVINFRRLILFGRNFTVLEPTPKPYFFVRANFAKH